MAEEISRKLRDLAWNSSKENLPPSFNDLLKSKTTASELLEAERRQLLDAIHNYVGDDPLKPWVRCIKWAKGLYASGVKSELLPLLESCTQKFLGDPRYREDLRYLRIWIRFADCCPEPLHVFQFLETKNIGQSHSLYYEAYAVILELRGDLVKAEEVYHLGIARCALPVEQLQNMYKSFLKRKAKLRTAQLKEKRTVTNISRLEGPSAQNCKESSTNTQTSEKACVLQGETTVAPTLVAPNFEKGCFPQRETTASSATVIHSNGDETIAIKRYAEEAIVLGVDPEAGDLNKESHLGLVDPTINTKEAMVDVLSLFSQPLPLEQARRSRTRSEDTSRAASDAGNTGFDIFVDDAFCKDGQQAQTKQDFHVYMEDISHNIEQNFEVFVDESFGSAQPAESSQRLDPWDEALISNLLKELKPPLSAYKGFHSSNKKYSGSASLSSLKSNARNKTVDLGNTTYHIKGCTGHGAFAQVYQAHEDSNHDETVVLKIQKPPCPWEFHIYRQLDKRIPAKERKNFGHAWKMHVYADCSIMVADYGHHGTLQDVVNSYLAHGQKMDELLCMYYTIEMLRMLETLHSVGIIHGDFKPDNLLIRNHSENWEDWGPDRPGGWKDQGLCLIDWGRSIDMNLFPSGTEFVGDSKTSAFRCIEMVEGKPWTYQVDTYGLCGIVHCMLHGNYMEIQQERCLGGRLNKPKTPLKRYWNTSAWDKLFKTLLNVGSCSDNPPLGPLREILEKCLISNPSNAIRLKELIMKQSVMMYAPRR